MDLFSQYWLPEKGRQPAPDDEVSQDE